MGTIMVPVQMVYVPIKYSGAALIPSTTVGEAAGQERRPSTAANVDTNYGLVPKTMTFDPLHLTPAEANPPSASEHRLPSTRIGLTSFEQIPDTIAEGNYTLSWRCMGYRNGWIFR